MDCFLKSSTFCQYLATILQFFSHSSDLELLKTKTVLSPKALQIDTGQRDRNFRKNHHDSSCMDKLCTWVSLSEILPEYLMTLSDIHTKNQEKICQIAAACPHSICRDFTYNN